MSRPTAENNGVTSQYAAQVAADLERNLKEQERVTGEIALLQEQLAALEQDRSVLLNVQQALGVQPAPASPAPGSAAPEPAAPETAAPDPAVPDPAAAVPAPRKKPAAAAGGAKRSKAKKAAPASRGAAAKKTAARTKAAEPAQPSLVSLVREYLTSRSEPRSAAEIAESLGRRHPDRGVKTTVVRSTLEGLVAKNLAQRTKQGTSVFYTSPDAPGPAADGKQEPERKQEQAS
ncbi:hypothetical protein ACH4F6_14425 [Streptomyces sp. NPDC017936]|uniref:hypothetical protein n=1 Tax=Streptomyces sp. NPDC017936 TaxID=3365016 RepID=UPI00378F7A53